MGFMGRGRGRGRGGGISASTSHKTNKPNNDRGRDRGSHADDRKRSTTSDEEQLDKKERIPSTESLRITVGNENYQNRMDLPASERLGPPVHPRSHHDRARSTSSDRREIHDSRRQGDEGYSHYDDRDQQEQRYHERRGYSEGSHRGDYPYNPRDARDRKYDRDEPKDTDYRNLVGYGMDDKNTNYRGGLDDINTNYRGEIDNRNTNYRGEIDDRNTNYRGEIDNRNTNYRGEIENRNTNYRGEIDDRNTNYRGEIDDRNTNYRGENDDRRRPLPDNTGTYHPMNSGQTKLHEPPPVLPPAPKPLKSILKKSSDTKPLSSQTSSLFPILGSKPEETTKPPVNSQNMGTSSSFMNVEDEEQFLYGDEKGPEKPKELPGKQLEPNFSTDYEHHANDSGTISQRPFANPVAVPSTDINIASGQTIGNQANQNIMPSQMSIADVLTKLSNSGVLKPPPQVQPPPEPNARTGDLLSIFTSKEPGSLALQQPQQVQIISQLPQQQQQLLSQLPQQQQQLVSKLPFQQQQQLPMSRLPPQQQEQPNSSQSFLQQPLSSSFNPVNLNATDSNKPPNSKPPQEQYDPTIENILKSIGFDFELSKRMQEKSVHKKDEDNFGINQSKSFLEGGLPETMKANLFKRDSSQSENKVQNEEKAVDKHFVPDRTREVRNRSPEYKNDYRLKERRLSPELRDQRSPSKKNTFDIPIRRRSPENRSALDIPFRRQPSEDRRSFDMPLNRRSPEFTDHRRSLERRSPIHLRSPESRRSPSYRRSPDRRSFDRYDRSPEINRRDRFFDDYDRSPAHANDFLKDDSYMSRDSERQSSWSMEREISFSRKRSRSRSRDRKRVHEKTRGHWEEESIGSPLSFDSPKRRRRTRNKSVSRSRSRSGSRERERKHSSKKKKSKDRHRRSRSPTPKKQEVEPTDVLLSASDLSSGISFKRQTEPILPPAPQYPVPQSVSMPYSQPVPEYPTISAPYSHPPPMPTMTRGPHMYPSVPPESVYSVSYPGYQPPVPYSYPSHMPHPAYPPQMPYSGVTSIPEPPGTSSVPFKPKTLSSNLLSIPLDKSNAAGVKTEDKTTSSTDQQAASEVKTVKKSTKLDVKEKKTITLEKDTIKIECKTTSEESTRTVLPPKALQEKVEDQKFSKTKQTITLDYKIKLVKEKEQHKRKLGTLERELDKLKKQQNEIMRKNRRQKDAHKDPILVENAKLQDEIQIQIKKLTNRNNCISKTLKDSEVVKETPKPPPAVKKGPSAKPEEMKGGVSQKILEETKGKEFSFYDDGNHWCHSCNIVNKSIYSVLQHLHSKTHQGTMDPYYRPWVTEEMKKSELPVDETAKSIPVKGQEFLVPSRAYYCVLCKEFAGGDEACADFHLKSRSHYLHYLQYLEDNPYYEKCFELDKASALSQPPKPPQVKKGVPTTQLTPEEKQKAEKRAKDKEKKWEKPVEELDDGQNASVKIEPFGKFSYKSKGNETDKQDGKTKNLKNDNNSTLRKSTEEKTEEGEKTPESGSTKSRIAISLKNVAKPIPTIVAKKTNPLLPPWKSISSKEITAKPTFAKGESKIITGKIQKPSESSKPALRGKFLNLETQALKGKPSSSDTGEETKPKFTAEDILKAFSGKSKECSEELEKKVDKSKKGNEKSSVSNVSIKTEKDQNFSGKGKADIKKLKPSENSEIGPKLPEKEITMPVVAPVPELNTEDSKAAVADNTEVVDMDIDDEKNEEPAIQAVVEMKMDTTDTKADSAPAVETPSTHKDASAVETAPTVKAASSIETAPTVKAASSIETASTVKAASAIETASTVKAASTIETVSTVKTAESSEAVSTVETAPGVGNETNSEKDDGGDDFEKSKGDYLSDSYSSVKYDLTIPLELFSDSTEGNQPCGVKSLEENVHVKDSHDVGSDVEDHASNASGVSMHMGSDFEIVDECEDEMS